MSTIKPVSPEQFFADGIRNINDNFNAVMQVAQSVKFSANDSGIATPVLMTMGADATRWKLPEGVEHGFIVLDHGFVLRSDQYEVEGDEVVLSYVPAEPYAIAVAWSVSKGGITAPVPIQMNEAMGPRYWILPEEKGANTLIFDHGRMLKRSEFQVDGNQVKLNYTPAQPYDISASWGYGGPGMIAPVSLVRKYPTDELNTREYLLPFDHGRTVIVFDHGLMLDAQDYTVDFETRTVTLSYNPAEPLDISASWGFPSDGLFVDDIVPTPAPNGVRKHFVLPQEPAPETVRARIRLSNGAVQYLTNGVDFHINGRRIDFAVAPAGDSTILLSYMAVVLNEQLYVDKVDGLDAVTAFAPGLGTPAQGGVLVAVDNSGKLPAAIIPDAPTVDGFSAISSTDPRVGTPAAANYLVALDLNGRLDNDTLPYNPVIGVDNNSVTFNNGVQMDINTLTEEYTVNSNGSLAQVTWKNAQGATVKMVRWEYLPDGRIDKQIETTAGLTAEGQPYPGKTLTIAFTYDQNGNLTGVTKTVV